MSMYILDIDMCFLWFGKMGLPLKKRLLDFRVKRCASWAGNFVPILQRYYNEEMVLLSMTEGHGDVSVSKLMVLVHFL